jgi:hypothetical protein
MGVVFSIYIHCKYSYAYIICVQTCTQLPQTYCHTLVCGCICYTSDKLKVRSLYYPNFNERTTMHQPHIHSHSLAHTHKHTHTQQHDPLWWLICLCKQITVYVKINFCSHECVKLHGRRWSASTREILRHPIVWFTSKSRQKAPKETYNTVRTAQTTLKSALRTNPHNVWICR